MARDSLEDARKIEWSFPTSMGRPVKWELPKDWIVFLNKRKDVYVEAAKFLAEKGEQEMAVEIAAYSWRAWIITRWEEKGRLFLSHVLDQEPQRPTRARALALYGDGLLAFRLGKIRGSRERNQEALEIALQIQDNEALGFAHLGLSRTSFEQGNYKEALAHALKARELLSKLGPAYDQAPLFMQAQSVRMLRDYDLASTLMKQSVELNRKIDDKGMIAAELANLSRVEIHRGNADYAEQCYDESEKLGFFTSKYDLSMALLSRAAVAHLRGDQETAQSFLVKSKNALKESGVDPGPDDKFDLEWISEKIEGPTTIPEKVEASVRAQTLPASEPAPRAR